MIRLLFAALLALLPLAAHAQSEQQTLVDRATLAVQEMLGDPGAADARDLLRKGKGVMICPRVFKAGFIFGAQGGSCVMVARDGTGWTNPAFYGMGSGSFGLQIGVQDAEIMFVIRTEKGFQALLDNQFKIGADVSIAFANIGAGLGGSTTSALDADVVAFALTRGLFAGVSLDGSMISSRSEWNKEYYGQPLAASQILQQRQGTNPGAEPLRNLLAHFSNG